MGDLKSKRLICVKACLFLLTGVTAAGLILLESPDLRTLSLLAICIWSFCRLYYFAFYVIEHYVDDSYRFRGVWDFLKYCRRSLRSLPDR